MGPGAEEGTGIMVVDITLSWIRFDSIHSDTNIFRFVIPGLTRNPVSLHTGSLLSQGRSDGLGCD
jgi:hypothetical protein